MVVKLRLSALRESHWSGHLVRFVLGGLVTVFAGLVSKWAGPVVGGLFLAFPAIFPASATLVEKHERRKKREAGIAFTLRGRLSAALDARGAAIGSLALLGFAVVAWRLLPVWTPWSALSAAFLTWLTIAVGGWWLRRRARCIRRRPDEPVLR
jgi:hypothetical protein